MLVNNVSTISLTLYAVCFILVCSLSHSTVVVNVHKVGTSDTLYTEGSVYHAVKSQTDSNPTTTASGYNIRDPTNPGRIVAVPQSWIANSLYSFGDTITVLCDSCILQGYWIIEDVMNKRYDYPNDCRIDFLQPPKITGLYDIKILLD